MKLGISPRGATSIFVLATLNSACTAPTTSESTSLGTARSADVADILGMTRRADGQLDVKCKGKNGAPDYTQVVTDADVAAQKVCTSRGGLPKEDGVLVTNLDSPFADPDRSYLTWRDLDALRRRGALTPLDEGILERLSVAEGGAAAPQRLPIATLQAADRPSVWLGLLPDERARMPYLWSLFAIAPDAPRETVEWPVVSFETTLSDPPPTRLEGTPPVAISSFPSPAQPALVRAAQYGGAPAGKITWEALHQSISGPFTAPERDQLKEALERVTRDLHPAVPAFTVVWNQAEVLAHEFTVDGISVKAWTQPIVRYVRWNSFRCGVRAEMYPRYVADVGAGRALYFNWPLRFDGGWTPPPDVDGSATPSVFGAVRDLRGRYVVEAWSGAQVTGQVIVEASKQAYATTEVTSASTCGYLTIGNGVPELETDVGSKEILALPPGRYPLVLAGLPPAVSAYLDIFTTHLARMTVGTAHSELLHPSANGAWVEGQFESPSSLCPYNFYLRAYLGAMNPKHLMVRCVDETAHSTNATPYYADLDPATRL